jgi:hypothetical protein
LTKKNYIHDIFKGIKSVKDLELIRPTRSIPIVRLCAASAWAYVLLFHAPLHLVPQPGKSKE